ncbi:CYTH domain-containing protein [Marinobacterium sp. D7]|uniref:CYTH domain-containing protein n=1 Tax=Marinobacterium ramblicola TaxID=2849041 RepID=UPI001C2D12EF|nr:CYTH domain-containing protein [Marinobacterium ramblicola]MBV1790627.1 CYTH domain-containing protein [Marinobacterium ramblicola]
MGSETELKLGLLPEYSEEVAALPLLEQLSYAKPERRTLTNIYYDTPAQDLRRARVALRIRRDGERYIQTLKSAGSGQAGLSVRSEWEWERPEPSLDLGQLREYLPPALCDDALLAALQPAFETNFERNLWWLGGESDDGAWQVEVALDRGEIRVGERSMPLYELELELKAGQSDQLFHLALEIARQLPVQVRDASKAQRGYELAGAAAPLPCVEPGFNGDATLSLVGLIGACLKAWPVQLEAAMAGDEQALQALARTLDLQLVALESLPEVAEHCQVLISQYQRLRADVARAHDWRLLSCMPQTWQSAQREAGLKLLQGLRHKTLPGQLALATGELLWQIVDDGAAEE